MQGLKYQPRPIQLEQVISALAKLAMNQISIFETSLLLGFSCLDTMATPSLLSFWAGLFCFSSLAFSVWSY